MRVPSLQLLQSLNTRMEKYWTGPADERGGKAQRAGAPPSSYDTEG